MDTPNWPNEELQKQRSKMDPLADRFVAEAAEVKSERDLYLFMRKLLNEFTFLTVNEMDASTQEYYKQATILPEWVDHDLLAKGHEFFNMHGPEICMVLLMKALPSTYCCKKGAEVVHSTGRLSDHSGNLHPFTRRLMETSKFVLNVLSKNAFAPDGKGIHFAFQVRTLHAFIRHFLKDKDWNVEEFDEPINQEDSAGTMLAFSAFVIEGLEILGLKISHEERDAYFHVWRIVAHLMGVEKEMIADNYEEGSLLGHAILDHQKAPSKAGQELTAACLDFLQRLMPTFLLKWVPRNFMYHLMGKELSEMVGIKRSRNIFVKFIVFLSIRIIRVLEWLKHHVGFIGRFARWLNPKVLNWLIKKFLRQQGTPFTPSIIQDEVRKIKGKHP